ncbi:MAG TPA: hypothetical protein DCQ14_01240 [Firmicutes bacterium]|nr:hypothetical protein [Bacillota bacterium]
MKVTVCQTAPRLLDVKGNLEVESPVNKRFAGFDGRKPKFQRRNFIVLWEYVQKADFEAYRAI